MVETVNATPLVSAIIVVRNGEAFIREAIDSVLAQTLTTWELLVVDDGSTDSTLTIVRPYQTDLPDRVFLLKHAGGSNRGISASRNLGIDAARGTYIGFLDADDVWLPGKLAEQVAIMEADRDLGLIYGRTLIWFSWAGNPQTSDFYYPLGVQPDARYDPPKLFEILMENKCQTPTTCNALMRADIFRKLGGFDEKFPLMFEDQTFFAKALALSPAYVSDLTWAKYRQHTQSCSALSASAGADEIRRLAFLWWLRSSLGRFNPSPQVRWTIWQTIVQSLRSYAKQRLRNSR